MLRPSLPHERTPPFYGSHLAETLIDDLADAAASAQRLPVRVDIDRTELYHHFASPAHAA